MHVYQQCSLGSKDSAPKIFSRYTTCLYYLFGVLDNRKIFWENEQIRNYSQPSLIRSYLIRHPLQWVFCPVHWGGLYKWELTVHVLLLTVLLLTCWLYMNYYLWIVLFKFIYLDWFEKRHVNMRVSFNKISIYL